MRKGTNQWPESSSYGGYEGHEGRSRCVRWHAEPEPGHGGNEALERVLGGTAPILAARVRPHASAGSSCCIHELQHGRIQVIAVRDIPSVCGEDNDGGDAPLLTRGAMLVDCGKDRWSIRPL